MKRIGIIGFGAAGSQLVDWFTTNPSDRFKLVGLCVRQRQHLSAKHSAPEETRVCSNIDELLECAPDIVVEAAGQKALAESGAKVLARGCELQVLSIGALADERLRNEFSLAAAASGARVTIPAGALAGFRGLMTLRQCGLESVAYTSTKPPRAWVGTPAGEDFNLAEIKEAQIIYRGNAAEAARRFPANANVAAAVALAGIGFEKTFVRLIADPATELNTGRLEAVSRVATLSLTISGRALAENPKTSEITAMSVISGLQNSAETISFV